MQASASGSKRRSAMNDAEKKICGRMARLCSAREYCKKDIAAKIASCAGGEDIDCDAIISYLCLNKYIDENRYAAFFARDKSTLQGWGERKIRYALSIKGLDRETIDGALQSIDQAGAHSRMQSLLAAKWRTIGGEGQEPFAKLLRYGESRGYSYEQIKAFYDNIRRG